VDKILRGFNFADKRKKVIYRPLSEFILCEFILCGVILCGVILCGVILCEFI